MKEMTSTPTTTLAMTPMMRQLQDIYVRMCEVLINSDIIEKFRCLSCTLTEKIGRRPFTLMRLIETAIYNDTSGRRRE
jgi:hypothetical protein